MPGASHTTMRLEEQGLGWLRVAEEAAIAAFPWVGRGNKNCADEAAVTAMRDAINRMHIRGCVVIGEGEIDEAPMLHIGEVLGQGGPAVDIAVDPIEGTRMTASGQPNALAVLAVAPQGALLAAPDMYMEKLAVGPRACGAIDLERPLADNLRRVAEVACKPLSDLGVAVLDKPRHRQIIEQLRQLGVRVFEVPDGDVAASLMTAIDSHLVDVMYGIGGAPEGVVSAVAMKALGGDLQARLVLRHRAKGDTPENRRRSKAEQARCADMGIEPGVVLPLDRLVQSDQCLFVGAGITDGEIVPGVSQDGAARVVHSLLVSADSGAVRRTVSRYPSD